MVAYSNSTLISKLLPDHVLWLSMEIATSGLNIYGNCALKYVPNKYSLLIFSGVDLAV